MTKASSYVKNVNASIGKKKLEPIYKMLSSKTVNRYEINSAAKVY